MRDGSSSIQRSLVPFLTARIFAIPQQVLSHEYRLRRSSHFCCATTTDCFQHTNTLTMAELPKIDASPALLFEETNERVVIHPLVLLHILDHHTRRQEDSGRVIGTLLGRRDGGLVEVTNCFAVPHAERGDEVAIGKDFNKTMLNLHLRTNRKESVVGWYASSGAEGPLLTDTSSLIHEFYAGEVDDGEPVHLVVDTRLKDDSLNVRAYKNTPAILQGEAMGNLFHELDMTLESSEAESICLNEMVKQSSSDAVQYHDDSISGLQVSMEKLHSLLATALEYVDSVVDGKTSPDAESGRKIADALATIPRVRPEVFDRLFHDSLQDLLMVTYLSNITRTQMTISEKINATL